MSSTGRGIFLPALADMRRRWLLVVTLGAAAAGAAAAFSFTATKRYQATASFVVAPVAPSDPTLLGIDVLHDTSRRTAAETAARLAVSPQVAEAVRVRLGLRRTRAEILDAVSARPAPGSAAVEVTATDTAPARAAQLANGFVDAFAAARTAGFQSEVASAVKRLQARLVAMPPNRRVSAEGAQLQRRLADLRALVGTSDPTIRHGSEAVAPSSPAWPHPVAWTVYGGLIGLAAGALLALVLAIGAALRRSETAEGPVHDSGVSERIVARLEKRLAARVDELATERERLTAREAALAVRERDVTAKTKELRAAAAAAPAEEPAPADPAQEQALAERLAALEQREREVARRSAELKVLQSLLKGDQEDAERRAQDLKAREAELAATPWGPEPVAAEPEEPVVDEPAVEEPVSVERVAPTPTPASPAPARPLEPPVPEPAPLEPAPEAQAAHPGGEGWNLHELERLVAEHAEDNPEQLAEWTSYLFYLRDYSTSDGRVPRQFDSLIEDAFGDLLVPQ